MTFKFKQLFGIFSLLDPKSSENPNNCYFLYVPPSEKYSNTPMDIICHIDCWNDCDTIESRGQNFIG